MRRLVPLVALALSLSGCFEKQGTPNVAPDGPRVESLKELRPEAGTERAKLVFGGTEIPVQVQRTWKGTRLELDMSAYDTLLEEERYEFSDQSLLLVEAASERYVPPLPLLKAPVASGDRYEWSGTMTSGEVEHRAFASVTVGTDPIFPYKSVVELKIDGGGPQPASRTLTLWFAAGKGIVKREFGAGAARVPVEG